MRLKRDCEKAVRATISMPPELWKTATAIQRQRRLSTFSDCMQDLIRQAEQSLAAAAQQYAR
ncbi:MAG TPA: hypothetical protein VK474_11605 [Chthoniobacterales bacterium]|nr:hypothetical protein [Chthoniobacterales bacterium]